MSYILDALRRADTERGRGVVPGLHSQLDNPAAARRASPPRSRALLWAVVALSAALVAVLAWMMLRGGDAPAPHADAAAPAAVTPPVEAAAPPPVPAPAQAARDIVPTAPPPEAQPGRITMPAEAPPPVRRQAAAPATPQPAAAARPAAARPAAPATTTARPAAAGGNESRIHAVNELPDNIRGSLPQLSIGGAMYSSNAASRMLIVNGQLMHEGDKLAPDLVLERIELKRAVLSFRGYRYSISY